MARIFLSYSRASIEQALALARDIQALGHTVWLDQELSGGQAWWDRILEEIRECDALVLATDPASLRSAACRCEYEYATAVYAPIVPVVLSASVSPNLLPPALQKLHLVSYTEPNREAALRLGRAISSVRTRKPPPDPLPEPPRIPTSPASRISSRLNVSGELSRTEQASILLELRQALREPEHVSDAVTLLKSFRARTDLLAVVSEELNELLHRYGTQTESISSGASPAQTSASSMENRGDSGDHAQRISPRLTAALIGFIVGATIGIAAVVLTEPTSRWPIGLLTGLGIGAATLLAYRDRISILLAGSGGVLLFALVAAAQDPSWVSIAFCVGLPSGSTAGGVLGITWRVVWSRIMLRRRQG